MSINSRIFMKRKRKLAITFFTLFLCLTMLLTSTIAIMTINLRSDYLEGLDTETRIINYNLKLSATYNNITIDDLPGSFNNWDWAKQQDWCSGSGTISDPYMIESHTLLVKGIADGIKITNSHDKYFIIRNCTAVWDGFMSLGFETGITLINTTNGQIINNTVYNLPSGISITLCENIVITNNTVSYAMGAIYLFQSNSNYIYENTVYSSENGISISLSEDNIINNNIVYFTENGFYISNSEHNIIFENLATKNDDGIDVWFSENNSFYKNNLNENFDFGIRMSNSHNNSISENAINDNIQHGIYMLTCNNNIISDNSIRYNGMDGIYLYESDYNTFFKNNISNNTDEGMELSDGDDKSDYNLMYYNFFIGNTIHVFEESGNTGNSWNNFYIGNYWDNYTGTDADNDGIGDTPHTFYDNTDYLPIWDIHDPIITIIAPTEDDVFSETAPNFIIEVYEHYLDTMWYSLDGGVNNFIFTVNGTINQSAWTSLLGGPVNITFFASDIFGHIASEVVSITKRVPSGEPDPTFITVIVVSIVGGVALIGVAYIFVRRQRAP